MKFKTHHYTGTLTLRIDCVASSEDEAIEKALEDGDILDTDFNDYEIWDDNADQLYDQMREDGL